MSDNVPITAGVGTDIATDDCGAAGHAQVIKLAIATDGSATLVPADANGLKVNLGADNDVIVTGSVTATGPLTDAELRAAAVEVEGTVELGATDNAVLDAIAASLNTLDNIVAGSEAQVDIVAALPAGTNLIGSVDLGATDNAVLDAIAASLALLDNSISAGNELQVDVVAALPAGTNNIGDVDVLTIAAGDNNIGNVDIASIAAGDNNIGNVDVVSLPALVAGSANIGDVDVLTIAAGDNNIGNVDIVTVPANPFGADADAASASGSISAKLRGIATALGITAFDLGTGTGGSRTLRIFRDTAQWIGGTGVDSSAAQRVSLATNVALPAGDNNIGNVDIVTLPASTNTIEVVGDAAHDAALAGNPVRIGARGVSADPAVITTGRTVDLLASLLGKQIVLPFCHPGASKSYASPAAVADTADDEAFAAIASTRTYITSVQVFNADATVGTEVVIKDGSTVLWRGYAAPVGGGCSAIFATPLRGTANTAVNVANITTSAETYFNLQAYSATE